MYNGLLFKKIKPGEQMTWFLLGKNWAFVFVCGECLIHLYSGVISGLYIILAFIPI